MAGRQSFKKLRARLSARALAEAKAVQEKLRAEMDLAEVRRAMKLSQQELAESLHIGQAAIAKLERRTDMYVSSLRRIIRAMGGELDIVARFPGRDFHINNFADVGARKSHTGGSGR